MGKAAQCVNTNAAPNHIHDYLGVTAMADAILAASGIYEIVNKVNGKRYIGSAVKFSNRFKEHRSKLRRNIHHSKKLQNAWAKYGEAAFEFAPLEVVADTADLIAREQEWLDRLHAAKTGYNVSPTAGSILGTKASAETKARMSAAQLSIPSDVKARRSAHLKNLIRTPEHYAKVAAALTGRSHSNESKEKMSMAALSRTPATRERIEGNRRGWKMSEEAKARISQSLKGRTVSDETRAKIGAASKGRTHSPEAKAKRLATRRANDLKRMALVAQ